MIHMLTVVVGDNRRDAPFTNEKNVNHFGQKLADENPDYIVMYNELKEGVCAHCQKSVQQQLGWVLYEWIHTETQAYFCFGQDVHKAEPQVVFD